MPPPGQPTLAALWAKSNATKRHRPEPADDDDDDDDDLVVIARAQHAERARRAAAAADTPASSPSSPRSRAILEAPTAAAAQHEYDATTGQGPSAPAIETEPALLEPDDGSDSEIEWSDGEDDDAVEEEEEDVGDQTQVVEAAIYEWRFNNTEFVSPDHPLFDVPYFGQVARKCGTAEEQCHSRWYEHTRDAMHTPKAVGLHAMIREFGRKAASCCVLEKARLPILEAREWANARERALVAEHGGPLRDADAKLRQTLNLTDGGTLASAKDMWYAHRAYSQLQWTRRAQPALERFFQREGHLRVPFNHVENGVNLGKVVSMMRMGSFLSGYPERKDWLKARGWVANVYDARWDTVRRLLQQYFDRNKDLLVPRDWIEDGENLGSIVHNMRHQGCLIEGHQERTDWLKARGWVANVHAERWDQVQSMLSAYFALHGNLVVPQDYQMGDNNLGAIVQHMRHAGVYLNGHPEREAWIRARGWVDNVRDARWNAVKGLLQSYYNTHCNLNVPQAHMESGEKLGVIVGNMRGKAKSFLKGHPERAQWCYEHGFVMHTKDATQNARAWAELGVDTGV